MRTIVYPLLFLMAFPALGQSFIHPGLLQKQSDFERMREKIGQGAEPWVSGWNILQANRHASAGYIARPTSIVYRGFDGVHPENYGILYNDIAAAYALGIRWKISGDTAYANASIRILDGWSDSLKALAGTNDRVLAAGLYGYEMANAGEIMRTYSGWDTAAFARFRQMMLSVFYPICHGFLTRKERCMTHFYANWDLCNMDAVMAIGVLCDDRSIYGEAIDYFKNGPGNGNIQRTISPIYGDSLGQWQESGRDQGHTTLGIGEMGALCEMAWTQGDDLYSYDSSRFLKGAEYVAKYNLGDSVPYTTYTNCVGVNQPVISSASRGNFRPVWELVYNHYVRRKGLQAPNCAKMAATVRPEGGGGNYGPNSGGYDQLGYGTLLYTLDPTTTPLPLTLLTFGGHRQGTSALLNWTTADEINVSRFEVQRSLNGSSFTSIGTVAAKADVHSYTYTDAAAQDKAWFYRLKMIDMDGKYSYSRIIALSGSSSPDGVGLFPNPAHGFVTVQHALATDNNALAQVLDMSGRVLRTVKLAPGASQTTLFLDGLAAGMYQVRWTNGNQSVARSLLVK